MSAAPRLLPRSRRGAAIVYVIGLVSLMIAFCSLAVDVGRVQLAKTQLQDTCDATARAAALGLATNTGQATTYAQQTAAANTVDGTPVSLNPSTDLAFGTWMSGTHTFTVLTGWSQSSANAVRISLYRTAARGNPIPLMFASVFGTSGCDVHAQAIAMLTNAVNVQQSDPATGNPFLAGMPRGSVASLNNPHNSPDYAGSSWSPKQSPVLVNLTLTAGQPIQFATISGSSGNDPNGSGYQPDGNTSTIVHNYDNNENGIADMSAPINSVVGVFLDDNQPNLSAAPSTNLDFSTASSRDFTVLQPQLKQIFFIGDGKTSGGVTQQFIVPQGATRLYIANWDAYEWNNNSGYRTIQITNPQQIALVK